MVFRRSSVRSSGGSMRSRATASKYTRGGSSRTKTTSGRGAPTASPRSPSKYGTVNRTRNYTARHSISKSGHLKKLNMRFRDGGSSSTTYVKTRSGKEKSVTKHNMPKYGSVTKHYPSKQSKTISVKSSGSSRIFRKPTTKKGGKTIRPKPSKVIRTRAQTVTKSAGIKTAKFKTLAPAAKSTSKLTRISTSYKKTAKTVSKAKVRRVPKVTTTTGARGKTKYKVAKRKIPKGPRKPRTPKSEFNYSV